jgi:hypothetical protein
MSWCAAGAIRWRHRPPRSPEGLRTRGGAGRAFKWWWGGGKRSTSPSKGWAPWRVADPESWPAGAGGEANTGIPARRQRRRRCHCELRTDMACGLQRAPCRRGGGAADQFLYEAPHAGSKGFMSLRTWVHACGRAGSGESAIEPMPQAQCSRLRRPAVRFLGLLKDSLWIRSYAYLRGTETPFQ